MFYRSLTENQNRRMRRARPVIALAALAFVVGAIVGRTMARMRRTRSRRGSSPRGHGANTWRCTTTSTHPRNATTSPQELADDYEHALRTATATRLQVTGKPRDASGGLVAVPVRVRTRLFGTLQLAFALKIIGGGGGGGETGGVAWSRSLAFPGLRAGEVLSRKMVLPRRATLLARDGSVLAEGAATEAGQRDSPLGDVAGAVAGRSRARPGRARGSAGSRRSAGDAIVGVSGLEQALDDRLRGTPGGELLARAPSPVGRHGCWRSPYPSGADGAHDDLASGAARRGHGARRVSSAGSWRCSRAPDRSWRSPDIGLDGLQPPGSTFKMVTVSGVLQAGIANPHTTFPYATYATLDGVKLNNANGEECGGTLELAFAVSCNSVFTPLGVKLGAARLVAMAERVRLQPRAGHSRRGARARCRRRSQIQGELDVGSTAIGQGEVLATPLQMATVAATIADGGRRPAADVHARRRAPRPRRARPARRWRARSGD